jgi:peptidoglycan-N-acetylglucosamine deacetylase
MYRHLFWHGRRWRLPFIGTHRGSQQLALTFDDGPNDPHTLRLLEVLTKHNVPAAFFMIGRYVQTRSDIAREVAYAGHLVGNHTFTHPNVLFISPLEMNAQLRDCEKALLDAVGPHSQLFRPPFGLRTPELLRQVREMGLKTVMWSVEGYDWAVSSVDAIVQRVSTRVVRGDVILLHDGGPVQLGADRTYTVMATDRLIARCEAEGYKFVSLTDMMCGDRKPRRTGL